MPRTPEQQPDPGPSRAPAPGSTVVVAISDLMLGSRTREALKQLGMEAALASSAEDLPSRLDGTASLLIVDLGEPGWNPIEAIHRARKRGIPVLAFGRHTDLESLEAARKAGADRVVPRSVFAASLPQLIRDLARAREGGA